MVASFHQLGAGNRRQRIERALTNSNVGSVLVQNFINRTVQQQTLRYLGIQTTLTRRPGSGQGEYIDRRTAGTTGAAWVADTTTATEESGTYAQASFLYRTLLSQIKVTRKVQAQGKTFGDVAAIEIENKTEDYNWAFENGLAVGDNAADANSISGLLTLINAVSGQVVANTSVSGGDTLKLSLLDKTIDLTRGNNSDKMIYGSLKSCRLLNAALQSLQQFVNMTDIAGGFRVSTYQGIPIVASTSIPDALVFSGTSITAFTGGATSVLAVVNKRTTYISELTPVTVEPVASGTSQFDLWDMFSDEALVFSNQLGGTLLAGLIGNA